MSRPFFLAEAFERARRAILKSQDIHTASDAAWAEAARREQVLKLLVAQERLESMHNCGAVRLQRQRWTALPRAESLDASGGTHLLTCR